MRALIAAVLAISVTYGGTARVHPRPGRHVVKKKAPPPPAFDPNVVNNPATVDPVGPDDNGSAVLRAQVLLDRAHFSVGEIDGSFNTNTSETVKAFQASHNIASDGIMTPDTWKALDTDTAPILVPYTITDADTAGPFYRIPSGMLQQAKLPALGYGSVAEELGERFHASPTLLRRLNEGKVFEKPGEQLLVPKVDRVPISGQAALVTVKKACSCLELLDAQNQVIAHYPATMGSEHDPLPIGEWTLSKPLWNPVFHYNADLFWDANEKHAKANIKPGPNNPVGVVWVGLSKEHYGIHGTPEPGTIGKTQSHGCIRLTNWDATEFANLVAPGMTASLREN